MKNIGYLILFLTFFQASPIDFNRQNACAAVVVAALGFSAVDLGWKTWQDFRKKQLLKDVKNPSLCKSFKRALNKFLRNDFNKIFFGAGACLLGIAVISKQKILSFSSSYDLLPSPERSVFSFVLGSNSSRLMSYNTPGFEWFFSPSTLYYGRHSSLGLDVCHYLLGILEQTFKNATLAQKIRYLNSREIDGQSFWSLVGMTPEQIEILKDCPKTITPAADKKIYEILAYERFKIHKPKALEAQAEAKLADSGKVFSFNIYVGKTLQQMMAGKPEMFDGAAVQTASRSSSHEGGCDGLARGTILGYQHQAAQGETFATMNALASLFRKHLVEPALAQLEPAQYPNGILLTANIDRTRFDCYEKSLIGIQLPARVMFVAGTVANDDRPDYCKQNTPPMVPVTGAETINCAQITSFAADLRHICEKSGRDCAKDTTGKWVYKAGTESAQAQARATLNIQMLGAVHAAWLHGHRKVFLTGVGMSAFKNQYEWFKDALKPALEFASSKKMEINMLLFERDSRNYGLTFDATGNAEQATVASPESLYKYCSLAAQDLRIVPVVDASALGDIAGAAAGS